MRQEIRQAAWWLRVRANGIRGVIDDGARELAGEYAAMLSQVGVPTRTYEGESDVGLGFVAVEDARYGDILGLVQGTADAGKGYLVVPAPFAQPDADSPRATYAWPGRAYFAGQRALEVTLAMLAESGLYAPEGEAD